MAFDYKKGDHQMDGYFDFVVPPLEGFWWQDGVKGVDYSRKEDFRWISLTRLPDFVTRNGIRLAGRFRCGRAEDRNQAPYKESIKEI